MENTEDIFFGVDYYPEHWSEERWETDARLMQEMGIRAVRVAEFSWHRMEPSEGCFDFAWLDKIIDLLGGYGIRTVLGTPTAAPPAWMIRKHPEIQPVDLQGRVRGFGGRHHDCQSNEIYRDYCRRIVTRMAGHYHDNKNVIGWQIDNELGNSHSDLCTCQSCSEHFRKWLEKKYGSIEKLDAAWGTAFWSQEYNTFEEIMAPGLTVCGENPSQMLDWKRFCSDLIIDFAEEQVDIIRRTCPSQFITHNFMGFSDVFNYYELADMLDFVCHDQYPGLIWDDGCTSPEHAAAASLDVIRSYKDRPYWIMEQQSGMTGWQSMGRAPRPGELSMWTLQSIAHGADAVVFFRWRTSALGTEQFWHGILPHSGNPGRRYDELKNTVQQMTPFMADIKGSMPHPEAGIVFSFEQDWAITIQPNNAVLKYTDELMKYYKAFYDRQIPVDFVRPDGDFSRYRLLVAPLQYLMSPELEERYMDYVRNGGRLILTMRTGVKDMTDLCMTERELPGRLSELAGIEVTDYDCLLESHVDVKYDDEDYDAAVWADLIRKFSEEVKTVASFDGNFYAGSPCITSNRYGEGICYYIGTEPCEELMADFMEEVTDEAGIRPLGTADEGVEFSAREKDGVRWIFAINHTEDEKEYSTGEKAVLKKGESRGHLMPFEVHILTESL